MTGSPRVGSAGDVSTDWVRIDIDGPVATVTFGRPPLNILTKQAKAALLAAFEGVLRGPAVRAIIVTGAGTRAFSAGADITEFPERIRDGNAAEVARNGHRLLYAIRSCGKPVVAAINGYAFGAGLELALCADIRIAATGAQFALPEATRGVFPGNGGTQTLSRLVGPAAAKRLMMLGSRIDSEQALSIGLVDTVVADEELRGAAIGMATELAERPTLAIQCIKRLVDDGLELPLSTALELEAELFGEVFAGPDVEEGVAAFREKRRPVFSGLRPGGTPAESRTASGRPDPGVDRARQAMELIRSGMQPVVRLIETAPDGAVPRFNYHTGGYELDNAYRPHEWATFQWAGFLSGRLWLLADHFNDHRLRAAATRVATVVGRTLSAEPPRFSAAGSDLFYAVCLGARMTGDAALREYGLHGVRQYAKNFQDRYGVFFQMLGVNRAVIDTGLNLLPFYWAANAEPGLRDLALRHMTTLLDGGIIRDDGSCLQALEFDEGSGKPGRRYNMQGFSEDSTWSRGQSWAMHGYVNAFEATGSPVYRDVARRVCRWYADHIPADGLPFYDFADPASPRVPRDSCSAAIAANALMKLARLDADSAWARPVADALVETLLTRCLSPGGVLLHGSWGRLPPEKAGAAISRFPQEDVMPYGQYWMTEALYRQLHEDWSPLGLSPSS